MLARQILYHLNHFTTSFFFHWGFLRQDLVNYLPTLALNFDPSDLCLPSN
jgi:hypothetical protein